MIIITSKKDGFRRCGVAHSEKPTTYADDHFTESEMDALVSEPMLHITVADGEPAKDADEKKKDDKKNTPGGKGKKAKTQTILDRDK